MKNESLIHTKVFERWPQDDEELWYFIQAIWGISIPKTKVCPDHVAPFTAFADAYFGRSPIAIWEASRGFGGKSATLAILCLTEALTLGCGVTILGGSGAQSQMVKKATDTAWGYPNAPRGALRVPPTMYDTRFKNHGWIRSLNASQQSVRGPHPLRLRLDEVDEMDLKIFEAAQGQPMQIAGKDYPTNTVASCFVSETPVMLADGSCKPISQIQIGDLVLGYNNYPQTVTKTFHKYFNGEICIVEPRGLPSIRVTPQHGLFTFNNVELPAQTAASIGLVTPKYYLQGGNTSKLDEGWIIGMFLAEGTFRVSRTCSPNEIQFSVHIDESVYLAKQLEDFVNKKWPTRGFVKSRIYRDKRGLAASVRITSPYLRNYIDRWVEVIGGKGMKKLRKLPTFRSHAEGIVRGWLAGDATNFPVEDSKDSVVSNICGTTVSEALAWQLMKISVDLCWVASFQKYHQNKDSLGSADFYAIYISQFPDERWYNSYRTGLMRRTNQRKAKFDGMVYDLTVEPNHTYIAGGILAHNSTHQYIDGTMTELIRRANKNGWPYFRWCYRESSNPIDGWLTQSEIERKKLEVSERMFRVEYDLQEPSIEGRAIDTEKVELCFNMIYGGEYEGDTGQIVLVNSPPDNPSRFSPFVTAVDWAKERHFTVIATYETDCVPWRCVQWQKFQKVNWPETVHRAEKQWRSWGGKFIHDSTGIGDVIDDFLDTSPYERREKIVTPITFSSGKQRTAMFTDYITAIERVGIVHPMIKTAYTDHKYLVNDDIFSSGGHPPDSFIAGALAWFTHPKAKKDFEAMQPMVFVGESRFIGQAG